MIGRRHVSAAEIRGANVTIRSAVGAELKCRIREEELDLAARLEAELLRPPIHRERQW